MTDSGNENETQHLASPSLWPIGFAIGLAVLLVGLIVSWTAVAIGGVITLVFGILWVRDLSKMVHVYPTLSTSIGLLAAASRLLSEKCVDGIEANRERNEQYAESTLAAATALNPFIGYDKATEIVKEATASGRPLREVAREAGVDEAILDEALDYHALAKPHD